MDIVDVQTIWQCGLRNISLSTDSAQTWEQYGIGAQACKISSLDTQTGWVGTDYELRATTDGGATWTKIPLPEGTQGKNTLAISLRTANDGYLLVEDGTLYITRDGGQSWSPQPLTFADEDMTLFAVGDPALAAIRFFDPDNGMVVLNLAGGGKNKVAVLRTTDGGKTWAQEDLPVKIGAIYLTHDGKFLTVTSVLETGKVTVLEYTGE